MRRAALAVAREGVDGGAGGGREHDTLMRGPDLNPTVLRVTARAPVKPTEDAARVEAAVRALFPTARIVASEIEVIAEDATLDRLRELVRAQRIPDTARGAMLGGLSGDGASARFLLGKQAAAAGRAHFGPLRSPLGDAAGAVGADGLAGAAPGSS